MSTSAFPRFETVLPSVEVSLDGFVTGTESERIAMEERLVETIEAYLTSHSMNELRNLVNEFTV